MGDNETKAESFQSRAIASLAAFWSAALRNPERTMAWFVIGQWLICLLIACAASPGAWSDQSKPPIDPIQLCLVLGALFFLPGAFLALRDRGHWYSRHIIAVLQISLSALFLYLTAGRLQSHFHVFASLILLSYYLDWRVLASATSALALICLFEGFFCPVALFGTPTVTWQTWLEYAYWIGVENALLLVFCHRIMSEKATATKQRLEQEKTLTTKALKVSDEKTQAEQELASQRLEISNAVDVLRQSGGRISTAIEELSVNTKNTLDSMVQTAVIAQQMKQTAEMSMTQAKAVSQDSQSIIANSESGRSAIVETVARMGIFRDQMKAIGNAMSELIVQGESIAEMIEAVDDFSFRTKLLSVNAAIEAAKSGENGRGFAIVANEVKQLSLQSTETTQKVRKVLESIAEVAVHATMTTEFGQDAVDAAEKAVAQANQSILKLADNVAQAARQIESSNEQQLVAMEHVVQAMQSIKEVSNLTVDRVKQVERSVANLNHSGLKLRSLLTRTGVITLLNIPAMPKEANKS
jgi:methyl-accepting chemotaxis protein